MKRIFLKISDTRLECQDEHPSLLAALESHNIDVEYQCRAGYCGSCRTRLVSGQVDWLTEPLAFIQRSATRLFSASLSETAPLYPGNR